MDACHAQGAARSTAGELQSSLEEKSSDEEDATIKEEEQVPMPATGFTLQQAEVHYNAVMTELRPEEQTPSISVFQMLQEERR